MSIYDTFNSKLDKSELWNFIDILIYNQFKSERRLCGSNLL